MVTMSPTQTDQSVAVGTKSGTVVGPPGPPKGTFGAQTGPFGGSRSAVEISEGARAHVIDAAQPGTLCLTSYGWRPLYGSI